jgi:hypothetical protein
MVVISYGHVATTTSTSRIVGGSAAPDTGTHYGGPITGAARAWVREANAPAGFKSFLLAIAMRPGHSKAKAYLGPSGWTFEGCRQCPKLWGGHMRPVPRSCLPTQWTKLPGWSRSASASLSRGACGSMNRSDVVEITIVMVSHEYKDARELREKLTGKGLRGSQSEVSVTTPAQHTGSLRFTYVDIYVCLRRTVCIGLV